MRSTSSLRESDDSHYSALCGPHHHIILVIHLKKGQSFSLPRQVKVLVYFSSTEIMSQSQRLNVAFFLLEEKCLEKVYLLETEFNSNPLLLILKCQDAKFPLWSRMQKDITITHCWVLCLIFHLSSVRCSLHYYDYKKGNTTYCKRKILSHFSCTLYRNEFHTE